MFKDKRIEDKIVAQFEHNRNYFIKINVTLSDFEEHSLDAYG